MHGEKKKGEKISMERERDVTLIHGNLAEKMHLHDSRGTDAFRGKT